MNNLNADKYIDQIEKYKKIQEKHQGKMKRKLEEEMKKPNYKNYVEGKDSKSPRRRG